MGCASVPCMVGRVSRSGSIFAIWLFAYLLSYFYRSTNAVIAADLRADVGDQSLIG